MAGLTVEEVLYTIKVFKNKIMDLNIPNNRLIKEFMNCLGSKDKDRWAKLVKHRIQRGYGPFPQTQEGWQLAKTEWIVEYAKDSKAKDAIISNINLLPGNHNTLTDVEKKLLLFNSFPKTWRLEFTLNRNDPELASEKEIKDFMEKKKEIADREENNKERAKTKS